MPTYASQKRTSGSGPRRDTQTLPDAANSSGSRATVGQISRPTMNACFR